MIKKKISEQVGPGRTVSWGNRMPRSKILFTIGLGNEPLCGFIVVVPEFPVRIIFFKNFIFRLTSGASS